MGERKSRPHLIPGFRVYEDESMELGAFELNQRTDTIVANAQTLEGLRKIYDQDPEGWPDYVPHLYAAVAE